MAWYLVGCILILHRLCTRPQLEFDRKCSSQLASCELAQSTYVKDQSKLLLVKIMLGWRWIHTLELLDRPSLGRYGDWLSWSFLR